MVAGGLRHRRTTRTLRRSARPRSERCCSSSSRTTRARGPGSWRSATSPSRRSPEPRAARTSRSPETGSRTARLLTIGGLGALGVSVSPGLITGDDSRAAARQPERRRRREPRRHDRRDPARTASSPTSATSRRRTPSTTSWSRSFAPASRPAAAAAVYLRRLSDVTRAEMAVFLLEEPLRVVPRAAARDRRRLRRRAPRRLRRGFHRGARRARRSPAAAAAETTARTIRCRAPRWPCSF